MVWFCLEHVHGYRPDIKVIKVNPQSLFGHNHTRVYVCCVLLCMCCVCFTVLCVCYCACAVCVCARTYTLYPSLNYTCKKRLRINCDGLDIRPAAVDMFSHTILKQIREVSVMRFIN